MHVSTTVAIVNVYRTLLVEACCEYEVDFDLLREAALRYVARAMITAGECEESDLIAAVAHPVGGDPSPLYLRAFKAVADVFDEIVVWSDKHGRDGRYIVSMEFFS